MLRHEASYHDRENYTIGHVWDTRTVRASVNAPPWMATCAQAGSTAALRLFNRSTKKIARLQPFDAAIICQPVNHLEVGQEGSQRADDRPRKVKNACYHGKGDVTP